MRKLVCTLLIVAAATGSFAIHAQTPGTAVVVRQTEVKPLSAESIERSLERWLRDAPAQRADSREAKQQKRMGTGARALIIAASAAGGFFAGGYLGHTIENRFAPCGCDDPGLKGALIGAPVGAIAGGVVAAIVTR